MQDTTHHPRAGRRRPVLSFTSGVAAALAAGIVMSAAIVGAAVPVQVGSSTPSSFVPVTPCRLMDTRPGDENVGPRDTPLAAGETHTQQVTGDNGNCGLPTGITGVALNATAIRPSATSFLTFFPSDSDRPLSSNLNLAPGQPPTPNKVDVRVSEAGAIGIFNAFGEVHLAVDVMGYYTAATPAPFATTDHYDGGALGNTPKSVITLYVKPPSDGAVVASSTTLLGTLGGGRATCSINDEPTVDNDHRQVWNPDSGETGTISGTRTFPVTGGQALTIRLVCRLDSGTIGVDEADLSAVFVPSFVAQPVTSAA